MLAVEERTQALQLAALRVEQDPRDALDEVFGVRGWTLPGQETTRPAKAREPGVPDWWTGDADASDSFLRSMGVHL